MVCAAGCRSLFYAPLFYGRYLLGVIGCDAVKRATAWPSETQHLVKCAGVAIVNALVRRQAETGGATGRETLLQFVAPRAETVEEPLFEYEGPIEILESETVSEPREKEWLIESGEPEDPDLVTTGLLKDGKTVNIACRNCNRQKLIHFADIQVLGTQLKATCVCGNAMYVKVELRREHRKAGHLEGVFIRGPGDRIAIKSDDWGRILITNLSRNGIGFKVFDKQDIRVVAAAISR